jgi:prephenate dehydratase
VDNQRITFLGIKGSYSHQAAQEMFPDSQFHGRTQWPDIFADVEADRADVAVVPVENALSGRIDGIYQELSETSLNIAAELILPVHHCLLAPGAGGDEAPERERLSRIKRIYSHPQGFLQCGKFIKDYLSGAEQIDTTDTANAALTVAEAGAADAAAISSKLCASLYGLDILKENIEDEAGNATRFLVLSKKSVETSELISPAITTILFKLKHEPGALVGALAAFADQGVNLTKLETYMASKDRRKPTFYVDVGEHLHSERMALAMDAFSKHVEWWKVLGAYEASGLRGVVSGFLAV